MDTTKYVSAYREPYETSLKELADLVDRLEQIDIERDDLISRMGEVREGLAALAVLAKEKPAETHPELFPDESNVGADLGLTDAIRKVLANTSPKKLTPVGVRTGLNAIGFKSESKNILPSIHSVLKRLKKSMEVIDETGEDGRTWYSWNGPIRKPASIMPPPRRYSVATEEELAVIEAQQKLLAQSKAKRARARAIMESANKDE